MGVKVSRESLHVMLFLLTATPIERKEDWQCPHLKWQFGADRWSSSGGRDLFGLLAAR